MSKDCKTSEIINKVFANNDYEDIEEVGILNEMIEELQADYIFVIIKLECIKEIVQARLIADNKCPECGEEISYIHTNWNNPNPDDNYKRTCSACSWEEE